MVIPPVLGMIRSLSPPQPRDARLTGRFLLALGANVQATFDVAYSSTNCIGLLFSP